MAVLPKAFPPWGKDSPVPGEVAPEVTKWGADVANGGRKGNKVALEVTERADRFPQCRRFRRKQALQMPFPVTTPPVKMGFRKVRRLS